MKLSLIVLLTLSSILAASGQILFKYGATGVARIFDYINIYIVLGLCSYVISTCIWIYCLSKNNLINVYIFTALTFVLVYLYGIFILKESISITASIGVVLVLLGLFFVISQ